MTLSTTLVPTYRQLLGAFDGWLGKAAEQLGSPQADQVMAARLADDMFPLATQVRFACVQAYEGVCRLSEAPLPETVTDLLEEGRRATEHPGSLADARARIDDTLAMLGGSEPVAFDASPDRVIAHELPNGMIFDLTAEQYVRDWAIPQFYFHLMAGYAILRAAGVHLGKADYVAHMFGYLRPGTLPAA